jgi:hypothetical protein
MRDGDDGGKCFVVGITPNGQPVRKLTKQTTGVAELGYNIFL